MCSEGFESNYHASSGWNLMRNVWDDHLSLINAFMKNSFLCLLAVPLKIYEDLPGIIKSLNC